MPETLSKIIEELNPEQQKAVSSTEGPVMVIAGPGTGKTQVIAARIGNILSDPNLQVNPSNILCLTYTDAGTVAMRQRLLQFMGPVAYQVSIFTFHGFCNMVIQENLESFGTRNLKMITELESVRMMKDLLDEQAPGHPLKDYSENNFYYSKTVLGLFSNMKREGWTPSIITDRIKEYLDSLPEREAYQYKRANKKTGVEIGDPKTADIKKEEQKMERLKAAIDLFDEFQKRMLDVQRYDYNDMINWVLQAFGKEEDLLLRYQERYHYFLVDEYQDTNGSQNEILKTLVDYWDQPNLFVVGDDDQSIYEFQGARLQNIMDLFNQYKPETVVLQKNYRSSQAIIDNAAVVINNNNKRLINQIEDLEKTLSAGHSRFNGSEPPANIISYPNATQEAVDVIRKIEGLKEEGVPLSEIAVIYYQHKQAEPLIQLVESRAIAYKVSKKVNVLHQAFVQNLVSLLRFCALEYQRTGTGDHLVFEILHMNFIDIPHLPISKIAMGLRQERKARWIEALSDPEKVTELSGSKDISDQIVDTVLTLASWIKEVQNSTVPDLFEKIINQSGVLRWIMENEEKIWYMQLLSSFFSFIRTEYDRDPELDLNGLLVILDEMMAGDIPLQIEKSVYQEDGVQFTSAHGAKGLEFEHVFLIGVNRNIWDSKKGGSGFSMPDTLTLTDEDAREESSRRLFYVAMTRAKLGLNISYPTMSASEKELEPSRYIEELKDGSELEVSSVNVDDEVLFEYEMGALATSPPPDPEWVEESYINKVLESYSLSPTHLNKYLRCPLSFYYDHILRVPSAKSEAAGFGTAVHGALQKLFGKETVKNQKLPTKAELMIFFEEELYSQRDAFTKKSFKMKLEHGQHILDEYYDHYKDQWNLKVRTEEQLREVEVQGVPINGILDKIEFEDDEKTVNVVDYKTGNALKAKSKVKGPSDKEPEGGEYWRQVVFYKILIDNHPFNNWQMLSGEIDMLEKAKGTEEYFKGKVLINPEDVKLVTEQIKEAYRGIMAHEFSGRCEEEWCDWCNFTENHFEKSESLVQE